MGSEFRKTLRTVQLGFYRHEGCDSIVNITAPRFSENSATRMPTHDTLDYLHECPRLYPRRGDPVMETLSRDVLSDLFWMCCCRAAALVKITPSTRRQGAQRLLDSIRECVYATMGNDSLAADKSLIKEVCSTLGSAPNNAEIDTLVSEGLKGGREALCLGMWEPTLGDCEADLLLSEGKRFANRAALAMHFLSSSCARARVSVDVLISHLIEGCRKLMTLAEPSSQFSEESTAWTREFLTGIPSSPHCLSPTSPSPRVRTTSAALSPSFGSRRSLVIPYEKPTSTPEEDMLLDAIRRGGNRLDLALSSPRAVQQRKVITSPNSQHNSHSCKRCDPNFRRDEKVFPPVALRLASCSPTLQTWMDSPRVRSGRASQIMHLTTSMSTPKKGTVGLVSHSEFARRCTPTFHSAAPPLPPSTPRNAARTVADASSDAKQGRRELMERQKAIQYEKGLTSDALQALRESMRDALRAAEDEALGVEDTKKSLEELITLKTQFDELFSNSEFMRNLCTADRADVRDRSVFLAKIIGAHRRKLDEQQKMENLWRGSLSKACEE